MKKALFFPALLLLCILSVMPARADSAYCREYENGAYDATLEDMAGRRLYVYGIVDSASPVNQSDADIALRTDEEPTRLEVAEMLFRLAGGKAGAAAAPFSDVPEEYQDAVNWLYGAGVVKGISRDSFGTGVLKESHFRLMLHRLAGLDASLYDAEKPGFTRGDVFTALCALIDRAGYAAEAKRPQLGVPQTITVTSDSLEDAEEKITAALAYAPHNLEVCFSEICPEAERDALMQYYMDGINPSADSEIPLITYSQTGSTYSLMLETKDKDEAQKIAKQLWEKKLSFQERRYALAQAQYELATKDRFTISLAYSEAYKAYADALDWLRYFANDAYSERIAHFTQEYIKPLREQELTDYQKAKAALELVRAHASYDWDAYDALVKKGIADGAFNGIAGFLEGKVMCLGYSEAYHWVCLHLGLPCFTVTGQAFSTVGSGGHAWDKVKVDGVWYNVDATWMDTSKKDYFLKSDKTFAGKEPVTSYGAHIITDAVTARCFASPRDYDA